MEECTESSPRSHSVEKDLTHAIRWTDPAKEHTRVRIIRK